MSKRDTTKHKYVKLVGVCPNCKEAVELILTKKDAKQIWKGFKTDVLTANLMGDDYLKKRNEEGK